LDLEGRYYVKLSAFVPVGRVKKRMDNSPSGQEAVNLIVEPLNLVLSLELLLTHLHHPSLLLGREQQHRNSNTLAVFGITVEPTTG